MEKIRKQCNVIFILNCLLILLWICCCEKPINCRHIIALIYKATQQTTRDHFTTMNNNDIKYCYKYTILVCKQLLARNGIHSVFQRTLILKKNFMFLIVPPWEGSSLLGMIILFGLLNFVWLKWMFLCDSFYLTGLIQNSLFQN